VARCKWIELKIKEIESQASKYAREIAACEQRKHSGIYQSTFEGFCSKSLSFSNECCRRKAIKNLFALSLFSLEVLWLHFVINCRKQEIQSRGHFL
jgi:hypothetical protein